MDAPFFQEFERDSRSGNPHTDHDRDSDAAPGAANRSNAAPGSRPTEAQRRAVDSRRASSVQRLIVARDFLRTHFFEHLSLEDLAAAAHMSPFHFSRTYRRHFGIAPIADLLKHRVNIAEHLLTTTQLDVAMIATAVGFECRTTLFRQFVRARGRSPLYFRRQVHDLRRDRGAQRITRPLQGPVRGGAAHGT